MYKPDNHPDISVYMMASDAAGVIDFARAVFGAEELMRLTHDDGSIRHAEIRIGDSVVMLSQGTDAYPAFPVWLHVYTPDVDNAYEAALRYGAISVQEPMKKEDPDKPRGRPRFVRQYLVDRHADGVRKQGGAERDGKTMVGEAGLEPAKA